MKLPLPVDSECPDLTRPLEYLLAAQAQTADLQGLAGRFEEGARFASRVIGLPNLGLDLGISPC
jgi:hypothetical protein